MCIGRKLLNCEIVELFLSFLLFSLSILTCMKGAIQVSYNVQQADHCYEITRTVNRLKYLIAGTVFSIKICSNNNMANCSPTGNNSCQCVSVLT